MHFAWPLIPTEILNTPTNARSAQPRERKAEITDEQIEENKRRNHEYQRQWRARKKAKLQNNSTTIVLNQASADMGDPVSLTAGDIIFLPVELCISITTWSMYNSHMCRWGPNRIVNNHRNWGWQRGTGLAPQKWWLCSMPQRPTYSPYCTDDIDNFRWLRWN